MLYVGLDVHTRHITVCVLDELGEVYSRRTVNSVQQLVAYLEQLSRPIHVAFEASSGYGVIFELLGKVADYVAVAHPGHLRLIFRSKHKNDRNDAQKIAQLLRAGLVPTVHVPPVDVRAWRELITFRRHLVEKRTRAKNGIRGLLRSMLLRAPKEFGLWSKAGRTWLENLDIEHSMHAIRRDMLLEEVDSYARQIRRVEMELRKHADKSSAVQLLMTIPGVGIRTAEAVAAFIDDPHRFANSKKVGAYFGLVPSQDQSGNTNRLGHITREGSATVRQMLTEAVWQSIRRSPRVANYLQRVQRDDPQRRKIAIVATAHYLVRVMWAMLRNNTPWQEPPSESLAP